MCAVAAARNFSTVEMSTMFRQGLGRASRNASKGSKIREWATLIVQLEKIYIAAGVHVFTPLTQTQRHNVHEFFHRCFVKVGWIRALEWNGVASMSLR